jgi:predicted transcriptional regulator
VPNPKAVKRSFVFSIAGTRGGPVRLAVLKVIDRERMNVNQIAIKMGMDYKTIQHHVRVLEKSGFVKKEAAKSENIYSVSDLIKSNTEIMKIIRGK